MIKPYKQSFIRWGLTMLDAGLFVFVFWYNPISAYWLDSEIFWSGLGFSAYQEGVIVTLWVWGISITGIVIGLLLLISGLFIRSEEPGVFSHIKGQLLFTGVLFTIAVFFWFRMFIFA